MTISNTIGVEIKWNSCNSCTLTLFSFTLKTISRIFLIYLLSTSYRHNTVIILLIISCIKILWLYITVPTAPESRVHTTQNSIGISTQCPTSKCMHESIVGALLRMFTKLKNNWRPLLHLISLNYNFVFALSLYVS